MTLFKLAFKNLFRKKLRSAFITLVAALAGGLVFFAATVLKSAERGLEAGVEMLGADILMVPAGSEAQGQKVLLSGEPSNFYMDYGNLAAAEKVRGVLKASPQLFMTSTVFPCCYNPNVLLVGYDPKTDFTVSPWIGLAIPPNKQNKDYDPVALGGYVTIIGGFQLKFFGTPFRPGANLKPTGAKYFDSSVFMSLDAARRMIERSKTESLAPLTIRPDQISSVLVKVAPGHDIHRVASDLEASVPGVKTVEMGAAAAAIRAETEAALGGVLAAGVLCWVMTIALMGFVYAMAVNERAREMAMLRAMGATRAHVFRLILTEALMLTALGCAAGVGLALALVLNFKKLIVTSLSDAPFLWPSPAWLGGVGVACVVFMLISVAVAVLFPAIRTCRREPYEALAGGR